MHRVYDSRIDAAGASHPADVDDWVACIGTFRQGATACLESTKVASGRGDGATGHDLCEINGTGASASYRLGDPHGVQMGRKGGRFERVAVPESFLVEPGSPRDPRAGDPLQVFRYDQTWRFLQSILDGAPVGPSFRAGLEAQIVMAAIERSAATGETASSLSGRADASRAVRQRQAAARISCARNRQPIPASISRRNAHGCVGATSLSCADCRNVHTVLALAFASLTAQVVGSSLPPAMSAQAPPAASVDATADTSPQSFQFAGTRWGASIDETRKALAAHGFQFEQEAEGGDLVFLGQLNDRPAIVIALFGEHGLTKVMVSLPTEEGSTMDVYREMRKVLGGEYGSPALEVERYAYPFANGQHVGFEMAALRTGKATHRRQVADQRREPGHQDHREPDGGGPLRIARLGDRRRTPATVNLTTGA